MHNGNIRITAYRLDIKRKMKTHTKMFKSSLYGEKNNVVSLGKRSIKMYENNSGMERNGVFHLLPSNACDIKYEMNKQPRATRKTTKTCLPSHACTRYESRKRQPHTHAANTLKTKQKYKDACKQFRMNFEGQTQLLSIVFSSPIYTQCVVRLEWGDLQYCLCEPHKKWA